MNYYPPPPAFPNSPRPHSNTGLIVFVSIAGVVVFFFLAIIVMAMVHNPEYQQCVADAKQILWEGYGTAPADVDMDAIGDFCESAVGR